MKTVNVGYFFDAINYTTIVRSLKSSLTTFISFGMTVTLIQCGHILGDAPSWKKTVIPVVIAAGGILFVFIAIIAIVRLVRRRNIQAEQRPLINGGDNQGHEQINVPPAAASEQADESSDNEEYFTPPVSMTSKQYKPVNDKTIISEHDSNGSKDTNKQGPRRVRGGASPAKLNVLV